ncbi:unnamed protein product [Prorocentrum cordatum]|uniref:Uncharacterized protein n=1 Tax=Prorocentrum cordatum TaxID=2364126 RepID=A0ABN9QQ27_9DINO|nr:unnamed protein product [Polarella glacialis]
MKASALLANLVLKEKCVCVPLWAPLSAEVEEEARQILGSVSERWRLFRIAPMAKALGALLGPAASTDLQWAPTLEKWEWRAGQIAAAPYDAQTAVQVYHERALAVASYKAQLIPLPKRLPKAEHHVLCRLLRAPGSWLGLLDFSALDLLAFTPIHLLGDLCAAARVRTATQTLVTWRAMARALRETAARCLSLEALGRGLAWPGFWEARPLAMLLEEAATLLGSEIALRVASLEAEARRCEGRRHRLQAALMRALALPDRRSGLAARVRKRLEKWRVTNLTANAPSSFDDGHVSGSSREYSSQALPLRERRSSTQSRPPMVPPLVGMPGPPLQAGGSRLGGGSWPGAWDDQDLDLNDKRGSNFCTAWGSECTFQ